MHVNKTFKICTGFLNVKKCILAKTSCHVLVVCQKLLLYFAHPKCNKSQDSALNNNVKMKNILILEKSNVYTQDLGIAFDINK